MATDTATAGVALQPRDLRVFAGLFDSRVMTREQLMHLYFGGSYDMAKKRLGKLIRYGYLLERKPLANPGVFFPSLLSLAKKGFDALRREGHALARPDISWERLVDRLDRAYSSLAHEVELIDLKVAFVRATRASATLRTEHFSTWPTLFAFETDDIEEGRRYTLKPDAYLEVRERKDNIHSCFLEFDRSTEAGRQLQRKAHGYNAYYTQGGFARRNGGDARTFRDYPFRVLYVVQNEERRNVLCERLAQLGRRGDGGGRALPLYGNQHWVTTASALRRDPLGVIWLTVGEYFRATTDTVYDPRCHVTKTRLIARDQLVAERAALAALFQHGGQHE